MRIRDEEPNNILWMAGGGERITIRIASRRRCPPSRVVIRVHQLRLKYDHLQSEERHRRSSRRRKSLSPKGVRVEEEVKRSVS
ncbi:hypothetical protein Tco_0349630 [Tanacetum coccineum]